MSEQAKRLEAKLAVLDAAIGAKPAIRDFVALGFTTSEAKVHLNIPYLVKGLFDRGQIVVIWGEPGSGKTFTSLNLALHVGTGRTWINRRTKKGRVLYICAESNRMHLENRVSAAKQENPALALAEVVFVPISADLLHGEQDIQEVLAACKKMDDVTMIVIDTLAVTFGGGDENGPEDMNQYVRNMKRIKDATNAAILIVHHCGKDKARGMRGHSSLLGALDSELIVEKVDGAVPGEPDRIIKAGKVREGASDCDLALFSLPAVQLGIDPDGDAVTTCVMVPADGAVPIRKPSVGKQAQLLAGLEESYRAGSVVWPEKEIRTLAAAYMSRNMVTKTVLALVQAGFLKHSIGGYALGYPPAK